VPNLGVALVGRWRWPLLVAVAIGLGVLVGLGVAHSVMNPASTARQVAVSYTYARLTQDYPTWWDTVAPACRQGSTKAQWISDKRVAYQGLGVQADPADTQVQVVSQQTAGQMVQTHVHVAPPAPLKSSDVEVDLQQVNGNWLVVGFGYPGYADQCNVL
jgi:hypothetical protein